MYEQMLSTSHDYSNRASTRYSVSCPIAVHMDFQMCFALFLCGVLLCLPWHSFFKYLATRFNCIMWPVFGFDIPGARHLIASEMSDRSCAKYAHRMVPLRNNVACSPSRIELFLIASASVALNFTLGFLTTFPWMSPRSSNNRGTCFWSASISINSSEKKRRKNKSTDKMKKRKKKETKKKRQTEGRTKTGKRKMFDECVLGVRANVFTTNELKGKGYHKEQSSLSTTGGHSVRAVVNVHVVNSERWLHLWFLMLQASVCDEQLMSIGGEIALSGNKKPNMKKKKLIK